MIQDTISRGNENAADPCLRKKIGSGQLKGLKQRSRALNDVKNTLQSHTSIVTGKGKASPKHSKIGCKPTFTNSISSKQSRSALTNTEVEDKPVCPNHHLCSLHEEDFCDEFKLSKKEIEFFGKRMRFFDMTPPPVKTTTVPILEDVETTDPRKYSLFDEEESTEDGTCLEIPQPSFY